MAEFHCRYESHLGQAILGFCVNIDCQQHPQFCLKCLKDQQNNHSSQCLGFDMITENLSKYIQQEKLFYEQLQEIDKTFQMLLSQSLKKIQKNLKKLQNLNETLQKREYLKFKTEINFFRGYYSKVEETEKSEFLTSLNSIVLTLKTTTKGYVKIEDQQIAQTGDNHSQYLSRAKGRFDQGEKLFRERKYQEALTAFNDSLLMGYNHDFQLHQIIQINMMRPQNVLTQPYKQIQLMRVLTIIKELYQIIQANMKKLFYIYKQQQIQIQLIIQHILIKVLHYVIYKDSRKPLLHMRWQQNSTITMIKHTIIEAYIKAQYYIGTTLLKLNRIEDALQSFNTAIDLNKNNDEALENKALSLHLLQRFNEALKIYDQAIFLKKNSNRLKRKADTLLVLGRKNEAKQYYFEALRIGNLSSDQEQILYQLARL
ncbi:unnamed protein product [Paramecium primaurelia]|uniref:Tetratricopeptide repeat protein n=3 Tax=Paramecium primaurelia TaxID=5886 RepID=A0A8S1N6B2_PARPR|nr:unnamed protein product [Paramecium primaurelia]